MARCAPREAFGTDWSAIRGFNYQPSYGMNGLEIWLRFDAQTIARELARGKRYFPHLNALRIWLAWDAFLLDPAGFVRKFDQFLDLVEAIGCRTMPVLFNRWQGHPDFGAIQLDHFMPGSLIRQDQGIADYIERIVAPHKADPRILAWDLCNEPWMTQAARGGLGDETPPAVEQAETCWLHEVRSQVKDCGATQPTTVARWSKHSMERFDALSDVLSIHSYYWPELSDGFAEKIPASYVDYIEEVDRCVAFAAKVSKPLIATECCWGTENDAVRAAVVQGTLSLFKSRRIGWMPHLLYHSRVADAHRSSEPYYSGLYMAFIEADGSLRQGHAAFNDY
jgi:hypothetical protein